MKVKVSNVNQPNWTECNVHATLPAELSKLQEIMESKIESRTSVCRRLWNRIWNRK